MGTGNTTLDTIIYGGIIASFVIAATWPLIGLVCESIEDWWETRNKKED